MFLLKVIFIVIFTFIQSSRSDSIDSVFDGNNYEPIYVDTKLVRLSTIDNNHQVQKLMFLDARNVIRLLGIPIRTVKVLVPGENWPSVVDQLEFFNVTYTILSSDLNQYIDSHKANTSSRFDERYHSFDNITTFLTNLPIRYPSFISLKTIGHTFERREIRLVTVSTNQTQSKPIVIYECGIHAREWISPAACIGLINKLINERPNFLNHFDVHVIPTLNVDGYVHSWHVDRFWRKNRHINASMTFFGDEDDCRGVDLNRNFDVNYGVKDSSTDACSENFRGQTAFDQLESIAIRDYVRNLRDQNQTIAAYFSVHSFGQLFVYPTSYMFNDSNDYADLDRMGNNAVETILSTTGTEYTPGNVALILSESSGASDDWAFDVAKVPVVFCVELRDTGDHMFLLPPENIPGATMDLFSGTQSVLEDLIRRKSRKLDLKDNHMQVANVVGLPSLALIILAAIFMV